MPFSLIQGQERPLNILKRYLEASRLQGGFLFTGPEGVGKMLTAKTLAKALNCLDTDAFEPCEKCSSCVKIENKAHPDIHFIKTEDAEIKIESIRQLQKEISFKPFEARMKVFIIDDAHKLNAESSNAILKILEEPTSNTLIILVTSKQSLLFRTIVSRCKTVKFNTLKRSGLEGMFRSEYHLDKNTAHFISYFSEGRIGRALQLKGSDILKEKNMVIDSLTGLKQQDNQEGKASDDKEDIEAHLNILATWIRDIYLVKAGMPFEMLINLDRKEELTRLTQRYTFVELNEILKLISDSILYLRQNINNKLILHNLGRAFSGR